MTRRQRLGARIETASMIVGTGPAMAICRLFGLGYSRQPTAVIGPMILGVANAVITLPLWLPLSLLGRLVAGPACERDVR